MRRPPPGLGSIGSLGLGHSRFDVNAGVTTSHLRAAQERVAARLAAAVETSTRAKIVETAKPKKEEGK